MSINEARGCRPALQVDQAGEYELSFRISNAGGIDVLQGEQVLGSTKGNSPQWQTVTTSLPLPAGPQTLRVRLREKGQSINWIEFARTHK